MKNIIIIGGAGFIGFHVVRLFVNNYSEYHIINVDVLTSAGNLENLSDIEGAPDYVFERVDIVDAAAVDALFDKYQPEGVIHLAAESRVDRSIKGQLAFVHTNINKEPGWAPSVTFEEGLAITIDGYLSNTQWLKNATLWT